MTIGCGAVTTIEMPPRSISVYDNEGAAAIAWCTLAMAQKTGANVCIFQHIEGLISRPGWTVPVIHMLTGLQRIGLTICVHSPSADLDPIRAAADFDWSGAKYTSHSLPAHHHRSFSIFKGQREEGDNDAWLALHGRADWKAARAALAAVESDDPPPAMLLLWKAVCAAVAWNRTAINELKPILVTPDELLILPPLLRGLAGTGQFEEADRILTDVAARHGLTPWQLDRMRADTRLDSEDDDDLSDAAKRLAKLTADTSIPATDRAETWHNLGTAHERLGERDAALAAFNQALALDPNLAAAREGIDRLRAPAKPSPS